MNLSPPSPQSNSFATLLGGRLKTNTNRALDSAARAYHTQCADRGKRLEIDYRLGKIKSWSDLGIPDIPTSITAQPFSFIELKTFLLTWISSAEARFKIIETSRTTETANVSTKFIAADTTTGVRTVGKFKLRPRQRKAIDSIVEILRSGVTQAVVCPLEGGEGKSVIGWQIIKHWQENGFFGHPIAQLPLNQGFFDTKASVVINMTRRGRACDVSNLSKGIEVISHTQWASQDYQHFFKEETYEAYNQTLKRFRYILPPPAIIVVDECQDYKKPTSRKSKYLEAVIRAGVEAGSVFIFMSATPWVTVNDTWLFCIATGKKWHGERITRENFPAMARAIAARAGQSPSSNSEAAMREFRKEFNDCYVIPPRDPRTVRAYNDVVLVDFESPAQKAFYDRTMDRYYDELERVGKGGFEVNKMTVFLKMRGSEERIKCPTYARMAAESHAKGFAPIIGVSFQDSVKEIKRLLVYEHGIPSSKISVVWGGDQIITKEAISRKVGTQVFDNMGHLIIKFYDHPDDMTADEKTAVRKYLRWAKEQARFEENEETQALRHEELMKLGLNKQSLAQRQDEIDKFQNGDTEFCIFTLSAGGTGVDLDHQVEGVRPREGFFTICYWAEEFMQALYRGMRIATLSDIHQHMIFYKGTIVANHVAPRLDKKIKSVRAATQGADEFVEEAIDLLCTKPSAFLHNVTQEELGTGTETEDTPDGFDPDELVDALVNGDDDDEK